jgi:parallel beta-helix repeat protein
MYKKRESCRITYLLACLFFLVQHNRAVADDLSFLSDQMLTDIDLPGITRALGVNIITKPGFYFISRTVPSSLLIRSSDVVLELAGNTVQGGVTISSNLQNITIQNGIVDCNSTALDGIVANAGCNNIVVQNMQIKNSNRGIFLNGVSNGLVANCELTSNSTGASLTSSHNIVFDNTVAIGNQVSGFDLVTSTTCLFQNCKALSTGQGNSTIINNSVCGFASTNGYGNIFERCIANGTQALSTTDANSLVAGFALRGTEGSSKIIQCESANATTSPNGVTIPYGIFLQSTLNSPLSLTAVFNGTNVNLTSPRWSPDGKYIAGANVTSKDVYVYQYNYATNTLQIVTQAHDSAFLSNPGVSYWRPDGRYLTVADPGNSRVVIYNFIPESNDLVRVTSISVPVLANHNIRPFFSPNGQYIVVDNFNTGALTGTLYVYKFDAVANTATLVATGGSPFVGPVFPVWSPDGNYLAVADGNAAVRDVIIVQFVPTSSSLSFIARTNDSAFLGTPATVDWSPNGQYIVVNAQTSNLIVVYQWNPSNSTLTRFASTHDPLLNSPGTAIWSPDGQYVLVGDINANTSIVFRFDPGAQTLTRAAINSDSGSAVSAAVFWSPDGSYISSSPTTGMKVYRALTFPNNNVIANNTVYDNSGGSTPNGVGISGSSIANLIIQNTAYSNPIQPFMVDTSYVFVQNVFNQQFGIGPTGVQNIAVGYRQAIQMPDSLSLFLKQDIFLAQSANAQLVSLIGQQSAASFSAACGATPISKGPITAGGYYCLANDITSGGLAINASNVTLDLNGRRVVGGIAFSNQNFVKVMNGVVVGNSSTNGVTATGSSNVTLDHVTIKNALSGVNFTNVIDSTVSACSFVQNGTGVFLTSCANIFIDDSTALNSSNIGFDLLMSATCTITNCKALSTGQGNTQTSNTTIAGFITNSGNFNIFENCFANGTQGLNVTDSSSLVAGFAFLGTENCSKIIGCESSAANTSSSGFTIPYGIVLQGSATSGLTLLNNSPTPTPAALMNAVTWSPDGQYLATGGSEGIIRIYQYNRVMQALSSLTNVPVQDSGSILTIDWRRDGKFLAVSVNASAASVSSYINIYSFCTINNVLTLVATQNNQNVSNTSVFTAWHPSGTLLASVEGTTSNKAYVYQFNPVTNAISLLGAGTPISANPFEISWSPDGNYLAIAESQIYEVYSFNPAVTNPFSINTSVSIGTSTFYDARVAWSPDGKYIAIGKYDSVNSNLEVYSFSPGSLALQVVVGLGSAGGAGTYIPVAWSNDSNYVIAGHTILVEIYQFNRNTPAALVPQAFLVATTNVSRLAWSVDGGLIAIADSAVSPYFSLYSGISFPSDNVIQNNVVYCNSGGSIPSGIGISGSSITNMIIQNTSYTNPIPQTTGTNPGPMVFTNYAFVTNVFNDQLQNMPTLLQNISLSTTAVNSPQNTALLIQQASARITSVGMCGPTALTIDNIKPGSSSSYGTLNIGVGGNYCLAQDLTVDTISINASSVVLDLNGNCVNGRITTTSSPSNIVIKNGTVYNVAKNNTSACIDLESVTNGVIQNVTVINPDGATSSNNSVTGIYLNGCTKCQITGCTISTGNVFQSNSGANSGSAIVLTNGTNQTLIRNCIVSTGNADNGSTTGGSAGHGILVGDGSGSAVTNTEITGCTVMKTGKGGNATGANAGGNGGNCIQTAQASTWVSVHDCTLRNTGIGGTGTPNGLPGKAIYDQADVTNELSVIFRNWAFYIANPTKFDIQAPGLSGGPEKGIFSPNPPTSTVLNTWANIFSKP